MYERSKRFRNHTGKVVHAGTNASAVVWRGTGKYAHAFQILNTALCAASSTTDSLMAAPCIPQLLTVELHLHCLISPTALW